MPDPIINDTVINRDINYTEDRDMLGAMNGNQRPFQPFIYDLVTKEKLFFQTIPYEMSEESDSQFVAVAIPGRNNPHYQFTGSEDTIKFTLSFYSDHASREDVIRKVRWLQALTKNNGYNEPPHQVMLCWGILFSTSVFLVTDVLPRHSQFNREYAMLPMLASVEITLKRVTEANRTRQNILRHDT